MLKNGYRISIVAGVVALTLIVVASILALDFSHIGPGSTPAIAAIIGFVAPTVTALLALLGVERVKRTQNQINGDMQDTKETIRATHDKVTANQPILDRIAEMVKQGKL